MCLKRKSLFVVYNLRYTIFLLAFGRWETQYSNLIDVSNCKKYNLLYNAYESICENVK